MEILEKFGGEDVKEAYDTYNVELLKDFLYICEKKCVNLRTGQLDEKEKKCFINCTTKFYKGYLVLDKKLKYE